MTPRAQLENLERLRQACNRARLCVDSVHSFWNLCRDTNFATIATAHAAELAKLRAENERQFASLTGHCLTAMQPTIGDPLRWHEGESDGNRVLAGVRKMAEEVEKLRTLANQFRGSETGEGYLSRLMLGILEPTKGSRNG